MDLTTTYLGLKLKNPLVPASSTLTESVDNVKKMEDSGASAVVMYSLFEEQINRETEEIDNFLSYGADLSAEALSYFPEPETYKNLKAEEYLSHLTKLKQAVDIPVIGSLNGVSAGGWLDYARKIETAGADALELNIYYIPTSPELTSYNLEKMYLDNLLTVKKQLSIPVSVKLSPYFSAFANMAKKLDDTGADGLVLFNRFYQPDIDLEALEVKPNLELSSPAEQRLSLRWLAILRPIVKASLAATTGIHSAEGVLKAIMAGADVTMFVSALIRNGIGHLSTVLTDLTKWMEEHEYESIEQMKGSMSYKSVADPAAYERANYMKVLHSIK